MRGYGARETNDYYLTLQPSDSEQPEQVEKVTTKAEAFKMVFSLMKRHKINGFDYQEVL